jgi:hypothetical protein
MSEVDFLASDGNTYQIQIDDFGLDIDVFLRGDKKGSISIRSIEGDPPYQPDIFHITHLSLDSCRRLGIGRRCLQFHRELFDAPITAGSNDGTKSDDGSYLTGDGPDFIARMKAEGIVCDDIDHWADDSDRFDDFDQ